MSSVLWVRLFPAVMIVVTLTAALAILPRDAAASTLDFAYEFPDPPLAARENATALASFVKAAFDDASLDLSQHISTDAADVPESLGPFYEYATMPAWTASESWGLPGSSRFVAFYRGESLVFLAYDALESGVFANSTEEMGTVARETAIGLGVPLSGSESELRIERGYTLDSGGFVYGTDVVLHQRIGDWPLGYVNRFAVSFRKPELQLTRVFSTSWLAFEAPQMVDPNLAKSSAIEHASAEYATELGGYSLASTSLTYVAWSWTTNRLVYAVRLNYTAPETARAVWVGVDVSDGSIPLSGIEPVSSYSRPQVWQYLAGVAGTAAVVGAVLMLWAKLRRRRLPVSGGGEEPPS